jgi:8-oxo-dGTP pyrophosphatase MutT (NUDIX family)
MNTPYILKIEKDLSIPWFEQIRKIVSMPHKATPQIFYSIKPPDYVTSLAQTIDNKFIILKQYRPVVEDYTFELPSGHVEDGETPSEAIVRELKEETNCDVKDVIPLGEIIPDTGRLENRLWAFYIKGIEVSTPPDPEDNEGIEVKFVTMEEFLDMICNGQLNHALDLSVIAMALLKGFIRWGVTV